MIIKNIRYIIKKIIIGVGISLVLMFIKGALLLNVSARSISSYGIGTQIDTLTNNDSLKVYNIGGSPWSGQGDGYLTFNFAITKVSGDPTSPNVMPKAVLVGVGSASYSCNVGTSTIANSTFNQGFFSASCPVYIDGNGVTSISIGLQDNQQNSIGTYRLVFNGLMTFEQKSVDTDIDYNSILGTLNSNANANASYTQNAINNASSSIVNNQNQNKQDIINNQNQNKQDIINNQNQNTDKTIESQQVCEHIDKNDIVQNDRVLWNTGAIGTLSGYGITDYIKILNSTIKNLSSVSGLGGSTSMCFYNTNKVLISCVSKNTLTANTDLTIPDNAYYFRATINYNLNEPQFKICKNGNQAITDEQKELNNTINDTNTDTAQGQASDFFTNFTSNSHGLSGVITAPLSMLQSLTTATCSPLVFQLPFIHDTVTLPCIKPILQDYFGPFFTLWQLITTGLISYTVCLRFYSKIRDLQNPNNDRIEVLNL